MTVSSVSCATIQQAYMLFYLHLHDSVKLFMSCITLVSLICGIIEKTHTLWHLTLLQQANSHLRVLKGLSPQGFKSSRVLVFNGLSRPGFESQGFESSRGFGLNGLSRQGFESQGFESSRV